MKITRYKRLQRYLGFYKNNFGFRPPYQVLIDGTFCQSSLKFKINIKDQLPKYLDDEIKLMTTACAITETESFGRQLYGATLVVKQFPIRKCGHKKPVPAAKCLHEMVANGNPDHYFVATNDQELSEKLRSMPGVPLLYTKFNAISLEKPSELSSDVASANSVGKLGLTDFQSSVLKQLKKDMLGEGEPSVRKKRRKIKGPNPLSCKKKKPKQVPPERTSPNESTTKRKRKRNRVKLPKHVTDAITSSLNS